ncbi:hypothetical protein sos41_03980 [Alphaproteobacteria bacterium SO-S41]|nr:hypothetical protein sos41_03980 [Alphaproteobacteria bacterium SO-S41]
MATSVGIITCVTNASGYGPGHTALWVGGTVYTFEAMNSYNAWLVMPASEYAALSGNRKRPLVYYKLNGRVDGAKLGQYLRDEAAEWFERYGPSVCSQRASVALNEAAFGGFDPKGYDTPYGVYWHAWNRQMVEEWWCVWKDPEGPGASAKQRIIDKLSADYLIEMEDVYTG